MTGPVLLSADPAAVEVAAQEWARAAQSNLRSADSVAASVPNEQVWRGPAKEAFHTRVGRDADRLRDSAGAYDAGARALHTYAQVLRLAQQRTISAHQTYLGAQDLYRRQVQLLQSAQSSARTVTERVNAISRTVKVAQTAVTSIAAAEREVAAAAQRLDQDLREAARLFSTPAPSPTPARTSGPVADRVHVVRPGDDLWNIAAARLGSGAAWRELARLNHLDAPHTLQPGWRLVLPATSAAPNQSSSELTTHDRVVRPGDTLTGIAQEELGHANRYPRIVDASRDVVQPDGRRLTNPDRIYPGWHVRVPTSAPQPATDPPPAETPAQPAAPAPEKSAAPTDTAPSTGTAPSKGIGTHVNGAVDSARSFLESLGQADHGLTSEFRAPIAPGVFAQANVTVDDVNVDPDDRGVSVRFGIGGGWAVGLGVSAGTNNTPLPPSGLTRPDAAFVGGVAHGRLSMTGAAKIDSYDGFSVTGRGPMSQVAINVNKDGRLLESAGLNNRWFVSTPSAYAGVLYSSTLTVRFKDVQDAYDYAKAALTHALQVTPDAELWLQSGP